MELAAIASGADKASLDVADARSRLSVAAPSPAALGAGAPGVFGDLGGVLAAQVEAAIGARAREVGAVAEAASALASALDAAVLGYQAADSGVVAHQSADTIGQTALVARWSSRSQAALGVLDAGGTSAAPLGASLPVLEALAPGLSSPGSSAGATGGS